MNNALGKPKPLQIDSYDIDFVYNDTLEEPSTGTFINPTFNIKNHDTTFDKNVTFGSSAKIFALADASFNENVSIEKHLTVNGDVSFNSNLDVSGSTIIHTDLTVDRYVGLGKIPDTSYTLDVSGNTNIVGSLDISGNTTITGNFYVDGSFNMNDIIYKQKIATENVFKSKNIPFRSFEIKKRDEQTLGEIFCYFILETILLGRALNINPFDQPSVELIKKETKKLFY